MTWFSTKTSKHLQGNSTQETQTHREVGEILRDKVLGFGADPVRGIGIVGFRIGAREGGDTRGWCEALGLKGGGTGCSRRQARSLGRSAGAIGGQGRGGKARRVDVESFLHAAYVPVRLVRMTSAVKSGLLTCLPGFEKGSVSAEGGRRCNLTWPQHVGKTVRSPGLHTSPSTLAKEGNVSTGYIFPAT